MANKIALIDGIDELLADRCDAGRKRLEESKPGLISAIEYNDKLAEHWQPGIKTRSAELERHELDKFLEMMRSGWLENRRHPTRPNSRALIIDLGAGNGKVVDWIAALLDRTSWEISYVFTDISPRMMKAAEARFAAMKAERPAARVRGHFTLCDITQPLFSSKDWMKLRKAFFPIVTVCAGGTIGNFGEIEASDDAAQDLVFANYVRPADSALVTFLDPNRIQVSLKAYHSSGTSSGMYDGQIVNAYILDETKSRLVESWIVPFNRSKRTRAAMQDVVVAAGKLKGKPFWLKLDMIRNGSKVGQVTRHYSDRYAKARFLSRTSILDMQPNGRAYTATFGEAPLS